MPVTITPAIVAFSVASVLSIGIPRKRPIGVTVINVAIHVASGVPVASVAVSIEAFVAVIAIGLILLFLVFVLRYNNWVRSGRKFAGGK